MSDIYRRQADHLAALLSQGYTLKQASEIVAHRSRRRKAKHSVWGRLLLSMSLRDADAKGRKS